ncbi:MAG: demethylmenaquinone methyltransferase [Melioribacteraceae bacterium]|nr:MAG: demethylmenaquinone methyltransferase [Melioribacteraceae bacterium]
MDKKKQVKRIFDSISHKYDFLNHLLSAGIDFYWRKKALKLSGVNQDTILLDVACGTGDFSIAARKRGVSNVFGADLSFNMLRYFDKKDEAIRGKIVQSVAEEIPFRDEVFTNITVGFGVRNFYDIPAGLRSFHRILKKGGKATILEFRLPEKGFLRFMYMFYFNNVLPLIGRFFSKDREAYTYLPESVDKFDKEVDVEKILYESGFKSVKTYSLTFGIVNVIIGEK